MNITSTITSNPDRPMIPSEASGKRKASDDNSSNTNGALKPKRPRNDVGLPTFSTLSLLNVWNRTLHPTNANLSMAKSSEAVSSSSVAPNPNHHPRNHLPTAAVHSQVNHSPKQEARETPTNASITKGKHRSPDEDGVVEEDRHPPSLAPRETPKIEQNRAMRGEAPAHLDWGDYATSPSVNDTSLYKHIDSELPDPDRARQLILLCAARAPLPAPREGKDPPSQPSEKGVKLFQDMKDDLLLLLAERKIDLKGMRNDEPGSATNRGVEVRANEQNVNNRGRTTRFKDAIRLAKAEDDAWTAVGQFYNAYQESVMKELEQRQKAKGKQRADPEEDLRISELPEQFHNAVNLARSVLAKDATGGHDPHSHRWSELRYQTDELHTLVHTTVQMANAAETDLDRRFAHLSHILHTRTRPAAGPPTQHAPTSTFLPRRHADPSDSRDVLRALARVEAARPANQVSVAASRAAREVQRAQDAPANERRMTLVAPPTPRTPRRPGDGSQMPGNKCSNCSAYNFECKYEEAAKKRGPPKGYVETLEARLEKMEGLLQRLCPDADFSQELGAPLDRQSFVRDSLSRSFQNKPGTPSYRPSGSMSRHGSNLPDDLGDHELDASDDEYVDMNAAQLQSLQENLHDLNLSYRFFGNPVAPNLIQTALDLKSEYHGTEQDQIRVHMANRRPEFWARHTVGRTILPRRSSSSSGLNNQWERGAFHFDTPDYTFPEPDLIDQLVDLYFSRINLFLPLLHRPTFERHLRDGLHFRDQAFASVLLCLCACASRYSDDPRVLLEGSTAWHSSGWKWFSQVQMLRRSLMGPQFSMTYRCMRCVIGLAARMSNGVARSGVLVVVDRLMSASLGRPCAIQEEDFDVDMPTEIDDEYWENEQDPEQAFKQPPGKPSLLSYFVCFIKLNQILAVALRTIYSINKSKIFLGFVGPHWEQHIVAELDSALNEWIDTVPITSNGTRPVRISENSSGFYSPQAFTAITITYKFSFLHYCRNVLLLNIWGAKRTGGVPDPVKEMEDVHKCMAVLQVAEARWHAAGRLWDVLYELASVGDLPLPQPTPTHKCEHEQPGTGAPEGTTTAYATRVRLATNKQPRHAITSDPLYSHPSDAFAQPPADILPPSAAAAGPELRVCAPARRTATNWRACPYRDTCSSPPQPWLAPHAHRHSSNAAATPARGADVSRSAQQPTSYGTPPTADPFNAFVASLDPSTAAQQQGQQGQGWWRLDMWQDGAPGYEWVFSVSAR
ncbi:hypothetical protein EDB85DRAFT_2149808 [Lactarius pseudohatsudake]|nr:hypothetical protein EDB85DRAFT_2149808 [Lactarius pseudohatsudake]